ncbi:hypothetical protein TSAR_005064 [Trichomalopsis sarcophagae]|uniref:Reverse transcriptase domain-containing protein n=1 Tax=Trichomalopsis sarcophagae TaxID=543379 RepID=A0A232ENU1_9HYME|nr:hypothetical protein TSAR_005064 [Trichomalopsis sarcophagae]
MGIDNDDELNCKEMEKDINKRNFSNFNSKAQVLHMYTNKNSGMDTVIMEVTAEIYKHLRESNNRIFVGYQNCIWHSSPSSAAKLTIVNWNANGILASQKNRALLLSQILEELSIDVACITETHLKATQRLHIPNYTVYRADRSNSNAGGGVATIVRNNVRHKPISTPTPSLEACGVKINQHKNPTVLAGDFNAKHHAWGCISNNTKGNSLIRLLQQHSFVPEAPPEPTHFPGDPEKTPDILDIFLTKNITIEKDPWTLPRLNSDHNSVFLEIPGTLTKETPTIAVINWLTLRFLLEKSSFRCELIHSISETDKAVDITLELKEKIQQATKLVPMHLANAKLPKNILALIRKKNTLRKKLQNTRDSSIRPKLKATKRKLHANLQEHRTEGLEKYISEAEENPKRAWKVVKSLRNRKIYSLPITHNGLAYSADVDKANILADSLKEQCSPFPVKDEFTEFHASITESAKNFTSTNSEFLITSPQEIKTAIRLLKKNKAPGPDGISNDVLKVLPRIYLVAICNIVNKMMRLQYFPTVWKEATVICLPKAGKPLNLASIYRPISLLCTLSKLAETIILDRLNKFTEVKEILPDFQHGFRSRHGTCHQLLRVSELLANSFNKRSHTSMLLLDAKQAFDRVWHDGLIHKLIKLETPHYLIGIMKSFLSDRTLKVRVNSTFSDPKNITTGVPQGSKLSPSLFNIFSYVDDTALLYTSEVKMHCASVMNKFIPTLLQWYHKWGFNLNETKSEAVFFSHRNIPPDNLIVNNHKIPWSKTAKYLAVVGVVFDRKLSWSQQITAVKNKANGVYRSLKPFFANKKVSPQTKVRTFNAIIRSICTYAIPVWGTAKRLPKLNSTYMRILRGSLNIPWFIRNTQILKETGLPSLHEASHTLPRDRVPRPCSLTKN